MNNTCIHFGTIAEVRDPKTCIRSDCFFYVHCVLAENKLYPCPACNKTDKVWLGPMSFECSRCKTSYIPDEILEAK